MQREVACLYGNQGAHGLREAWTGLGPGSGDPEQGIPWHQGGHTWTKRKKPNQQEEENGKDACQGGNNQRFWQMKCQVKMHGLSTPDHRVFPQEAGAVAGQEGSMWEAAAEAAWPLKYFCTCPGLGRRETETYLTQIYWMEAVCERERAYE